MYDHLTTGSTTFERVALVARTRHPVRISSPGPFGLRRRTWGFTLSLYRYGPRRESTWPPKIVDAGTAPTLGNSVSIHCQTTGSATILRSSGWSTRRA